MHSPYQQKIPTMAKDMEKNIAEIDLAALRAMSDPKVYDKGVVLRRRFRCFASVNQNCNIMPQKPLRGSISR
ncbi:hypothetical protein P4S72_04705 [Vibrio sp. PP-XX7]